MLRSTITRRVGCQRDRFQEELMGLMSRTSNVIRAWYSKLLNRAEDPSVTLDYSYERQREMLQKVKKGIADVVTAKKRLELQTSKLEIEMPKLDEQARQALSAGREDLARAALERKAFAQQQLQGLDGQIADLEQQQDKLSESEKRLAAVDELVESGTLEDYTSTGSNLDRELAKVSASQQVDQELERLKGELDAGGAKKELEEEKR